MTTTETSKPLEWTALGVLLVLLLIVPAGITVGLRNSLVTLLAGIGTYLLLRGRCRREPLLVPLAAWVGTALASALWSYGPEETLHRALLEVALPAGAMLAAWHLARRRYGQALWVGVLASPLFVAGAGIGVVALTGTEGLYEHTLRQGWLAAYPGVGVATTVAVLSLPFCLAGFLQAARLLQALSAVSLCAILVIGLISQNRAVWPALALTGGVQALLLLRRRTVPQIPPRRLLLGALCCVGILAAGWYFTLNTRSQAQTGVDGTVAVLTHDVRWAAWKIWVEKGTEHPLLGFGYGKRLMQAHLEPGYRERLAAIDHALAGHAHNLLLNVWLQTGILGLAALLTFFVASAKHLLSCRTAGHPSFPVSATIGIGVLVGLLAKNMTDDFLGQALGLYFWLLLGIALGLHEAEAGGKV